jgi:hypothetical protein
VVTDEIPHAAPHSGGAGHGHHGVHHAFQADMPPASRVAVFAEAMNGMRAARSS